MAIERGSDVVDLGTFSPPPLEPTKPLKSRTDDGAYSPFAGNWYAHGAGLEIERDGAGKLLWRTYRSCEGDDGPGPCDTSGWDGGQTKPTLAPGNFVDAAKIVFTLRKRTGDRATGVVGDSNDPAVPRGSAIYFTLATGDHVVIDTDGELIKDWLFCATDVPNPPDDCGA